MEKPLIVSRKSRLSNAKKVQKSSNIIPRTSKNQPVQNSNVKKDLSTENISNFYINSMLDTVKVDSPLMLVFKYNKKEISFENNSDSGIKVKLFDSDGKLELTFTFLQLEKLLRTVSKKKSDL